MSVQAAIFDCDGVLADSEPAWAEAEAELCRRYGVDRATRPSTQGHSIALTVALLLPELAFSQPTRLETEFVQIAEEIVPNGARAMPGAVELVGRLARTMPVGVASNCPRSVLGPILSAIGVEPYVTVYTAADEVPRPKPAPDVYLANALALEVPTRFVVVFEDSPTGVAAARSAGCRVVQVAAPGIDRIALVDGFLDSLLSVPVDLAALFA